ncbi:adipocyte enhancer-binding protein 1-like [Patiria miniata]|uniref:F5/8 type C domain-containing protein n=1 Tax=Patiria miniata TaxID=46514 RepID=A0A914AQP7_PATMI|nr:adipocyte enhancer-binding protein 1-like [Patiria miniata]
MEGRGIQDQNITASSMYDNRGDMGPYGARLNFQFRGITGWCKAKGDNDPWIQVEFGRYMIITGVITQGRATDRYQQWVKKFTVSYSDAGQEWTGVTDGRSGIQMTFTGNSDKYTPVNSTFPEPVRARFLRIEPKAWNQVCCMRFEVVGCESPE